LNWAAFSQIFGRQPVFLISLGLFALGAILCGVAKAFALMFVGRSIQGVGAEGLIALTQILITDMVPLRERGKYLALNSTVWAIGSVCGPILGGAIAQYTAWQWIFWVNIPIVGLGFVGIIFFLKLHYRPRSISTKLAEVDYIGSFLFVSSVMSFLIPITWGGVMFSWSSWRTLVPLLLGIGGVIAFGWYEAKCATMKILPLGLFKNRTTSISFYGTFIQGMILSSMLYYLPLYFQAVQGYSPIIAGVTALPQTLTVVPCAMAAGVAAAWTGKYRWALWAGWSMTTLGCGILYLLGPGTSIVEWVFLMLVSGIGIGLLFPSMLLSIEASSPQEDIAVAATLFEFFSHLGQCIGVAIGGVIFQNRMAAELATLPSLAGFAGQYSLDAVALIMIIKQLPPDAPETMQLKSAYANSFRIVWVVMCGFAGLAMFSNLLVESYDLNQVHMTEQRFLHLEKTQDTEVAAAVASEKQEPQIDPEPSTESEAVPEAGVGSKDKEFN